MGERFIAIMAAEGFEEIEMITITDVLRRAGIDIRTVSITGEKKVTGAHHIPVWTDEVFGEVDFSKVEMIILPGGMPGTTNLLASEPLRDVLLDFAQNDKPLAAICAAPMVLASFGILKEKKATIYSGMEEHLKDAVFTGGNVVADGNILTSRGPGTAMEFALALIEFLTDARKAKEVQEGLLYKL